MTVLFHAYGPATDTPGHLAALGDGDEAARHAALEHLWSAVIHQGTPWTVTPSAAVAVATLLGDPRLSGADRAGLRANLLGFLAAVAEACRPDEHDSLVELANPAGRDVDAEIAVLLAGEDEDGMWEDDALSNALYARSVLGCAEVVPSLFDAALSLLDDPDPMVRSAAAHAATACGLVLDVSPDSLAAPLAVLAASAIPDERATAVLAMGELGLAPREHLADPHPGVRACAALAPALAGDEAATAELLVALEDPLACDAWFTNPPPAFRFRIRFALVAAAVERVDEFARLLPAALAIARIASKYTVRSDWGPLLLKAFPGRSPVTGGLAEPQRRYLAALVDNPDLWDPRNGTAGLVFRDASLPYDRGACRALAASECA